jgi:hypothetical protein
VGLELAPTTACWADIAPVLNIYGYGPTAVQAERDGYPSGWTAPDLKGLTDLDDLAARLERSRQQHMMARREALGALAVAEWGCHHEDVHYGLTVRTIGWASWAGQVVLDGSEVLHLSVFRDLPSRSAETPGPTASP